MAAFVYQPVPAFQWGDNQGFPIFFSFEVPVTAEDSRTVMKKVADVFNGSAFAGQGSGNGILCTTARPFPLTASRYGVVKIVPGLGNWPGKQGELGGITPETWLTTPPNPYQERPVWVVGNSSPGNWPHLVCHELGHAFGLSHTPNTGAYNGRVMFPIAQVDAFTFDYQEGVNLRSSLAVIKKQMWRPGQP